MREIRQSGSEGGVADNGHPYPYRARVGGQSGDMRRSFRTHLIHQRSYPGLHPGLVCVAPLGQFRMRVTPPSRDKAFDEFIGLPLGVGIRPAMIHWGRSTKPGQGR